MSERLTPAEIEDAATHWLARAERGLSPSEDTDLNQWLNEDSRHLGAFVRAQAAWIHAERASALGSMPEGDGESVAAVEEEPPGAQEPHQSAVGRRGFLIGAGAIAASAAGAVFLTSHPARTIESGVGEIRHLALADGIALTLDTGTRVEVLQGTGDRGLRLVFGKIFLNVAPSEVRMLQVEAGGLLMDMVQGAFGLQSLPSEPILALVAAGTLAVSQGGGLLRPKRTITVAQGQAFNLPFGADLAAAQVSQVAPAQLEQLLAWRDGMVSFSGEALSTAVRAFDRYGSTRIEIADPELAIQPITGLFRADDPKGFATAIAASFGAMAVSNGHIVRILRKAPLSQP